MFDIAPSEFLLIGIVALVVIGPKDLPRAMRFVGQWVGRARGMARHFRSGFDEMVRQSELDEMEKHWASENARIMAEHPATPAVEATHDPYYEDGPPAADPLPAAPAALPSPDALPADAQPTGGAGHEPATGDAHPSTAGEAKA